MKGVRAIFACAALSMLTGARNLETPAIARASSMSPAPPIRPLAALAPLAAAEPPACPDPMAIMKAVYDANDAGRFDASLGFFSEDAVLTTWAEGVNGYHARERRLTGKAQIHAALGDLGLRRRSTLPDGPIYHETQAKASGDHLTFRLEPDRLRSNGKPYNPFRVDVVFAGCKIKKLTVVDLVTWL